jgi:hypothetical protein
LGLASTATAPADKASRATLLPSVDSVEQITVGIGVPAMIWRRKVKPSMPGISMSSNSTSGGFLRMASIASSGLGALPISSTSGLPDNMCASACRTTAESSTTNTFTAIVFVLVLNA